MFNIYSTFLAFMTLYPGNDVRLLEMFFTEQMCLLKIFLFVRNHINLS